MTEPAHFAARSDGQAVDTEADAKPIVLEHSRAPERMAADYELVKTYVGVDKPFDVKVAYTNEFLDHSVKMAK